jgi:hypothetical protein
MNRTPGPRNRPVRITSWVLRFALVLTIATGCHSCSDAKPFSGVFDGHFLKTDGAQGSHYLAIRATKDDAGVTVRPTRELWKPFRLETTLGLLDPLNANLGEGTFGISVLQQSGIGAFYILDVRRAIEGIQVEAGTGGTPLGGLAIPEALIADVAIASNGGFIELSARKHGDSQWNVLASAPAAEAGPYQASLDIGGLPKGTVVGFALARLTANGAPASPTPEQTARETIWTAIDAVAEAIYAIDAAAPDRTRAGGQLDLAVARLDAVLETSVVLLPGNAEKKLKSARKKANALAGQARGKKSAASVVKSAVAILKLAGAAVDPE